MSVQSLATPKANVRDDFRLNRIDTLQDLLPRFKEFGKRPAVIAFAKDDSAKWTYAKLADEAAGLATGLAEAGVERGDHLAIFAENSPEWLAAYLGVIACGAVAVPLDVQLSDKVLAHVLSDSGARYVFTTEHLLTRLKGLTKGHRCQRILLGESAHSVRGWQEFCAEPAEPAVQVSPEDPAVLFYTSGTTGLPKGVPLTHGNLACQLNTLLKADLVTSKDRILLPLPLHHVYPFTVGVLTPLSLGLPIVLPYSLTGPQLMRALKEGKVTTIIGVPRLYRSVFEGIQSRAEAGGLISRLLFRGALGLSTALAHAHVRIGRLLFRRLHFEIGPQLRILASGGAPLDPALAWKLEALGWLVGTGYGLTETSPLLTLDKPGQARIGSVGRPIEAVEVRIDPVAAGPDEPKAKPKASENQSLDGEVVARGPSVFAGYHNLPDETKAAFTADGWFRTGDLGHFDDDGYLYISGRVKTLIVLEGGEKVQPDDLEEAYRQSPAIAEVGIVQRDRKLVAVIRTNQSVPKQHGHSQKALKQAVGRALEERSSAVASYQRITDFVLTKSPLPRTRLGKIRRKDLDELYDQLKKGGAEPEENGPVSEAEMSPEDRALLDAPAARKIWEWLVERFSKQRLSPDTNLQLDLAIDSLDWLNLTLDIRQRLGVELNEEAISRIETVRDLLREVAEQPQAEGDGEAADPLEEPNKILGDERRRWLAPLGPVERTFAKCLHGLDRILIRSAFRVDVHGRERLPERGPFVLAPNHVSYLDSFVLAAALEFRVLDDTYWAGWTGVANGPIFRVLRRICHVVPIDPDHAAASSLAFGAAVLRAKHNLVWYPEGGHSETGKLMPFRPGIGMLLKRYPVPVVPVRLEGTRDALPPGHIVPHPGRVQITFGAPLDPDELERKGKGDEPHERITAALHDKLARLHRS